MSFRPLILIVDDRPENLFVLEKVLAGCPADIVKASSGNEALMACLNHEFALAICDVQMPEMDGYELAELMRADARTKALPIIFLSAAYTDEVHVFKGYESGAVDYLVKPFNAKVLRSKVGVFLQLAVQHDELVQQRRALQEANREMESFSYSVSHDLRAPLRSICGFAGALLQDCSDGLSEPGRDMLSRVVRNASHMQRLIDKLLQLSTVTRATFVPRTLNLCDLVDQQLDMLREQEPERKCVCVVQQEMALLGDEGLVRIILSNLLSNAWKFTANVPNPEIRVSLEPVRALSSPRAPVLPAESAVVCVQDNGEGFDPDRYDQLFSPFARLHSASEYPGMGIGLATVARAVARHGGAIWAEGGPKEGATFYFTLG
jgi:two-component system sensor histidine kinase/response regulator